MTRAWRSARDSLHLHAADREVGHIPAALHMQAVGMHRLSRMLHPAHPLLEQLLQAMLLLLWEAWGY